MKKILYIHGLKRGDSNKESRTATILREVLDSKKYCIYAPIFPREGNKALEMARKFVENKMIDIVVASSLGGFAALSLRGVKKIVINPCLRPDIELPKRGNADIADSYRELIDSLWNNITPEEQEQTIGVFSDNDELFSYRDEFLQHYNQVVDINGGHRISEMNIKEVIVQLVKNL